MSEQDCSSDVLVNFSESLHIFTGLLTVSTVCGFFSGIIAAALMYVFCLKPILLTRQGYNARRLFETEDLDRDNNQSDCVSNSKKGVQSGATNERDKKQPPMNSDVAAFASRARVVYPINQKYRPLADGASNPSLHEHSKLPALPNGQSSSSSRESMSQDQDNDDSSQFISSSLVPKSLQNERFARVAQYPHTLSHTGFEGRISLYCLALQDIQQHCPHMQEEKCLIFLQILKIILSGRFPKDNKDSAFYTNVLLMQEKGLEELKKHLSASPFASERNNDLSSAAPCTLEEIERAQKDLLEHSLQMTKGFSKQVEAFCQQLLGGSSVLPRDEAQDLVHSLIHCLLLVENQLAETQASDMKRTQEKLLWWEELTGLLQSKPALLRQEVALRQGLAARALEQMTSDGHLTFALMEKTLAELQGALAEGVQQCTEECRRQTKELVNEKCRKIDSRKKMLLRSHAKERSRVLDSAQTHSDPQEFVKVYQELLGRQRKQSNDLELQQDGRVAEAVCELWRGLHSSWSERLGELANEMLLAALPAQAQLPQHGQRLWLDLDHDLVAQLQQAESTTRRQLEGLRAQLDQEAQMWTEEAALALACLRHLGEQQLKILRGMVVRQSYMLNSHVGMLIEKKQHLLIAAVQRHFVARHFCLRVLKEMRLSKLKVLSQSDFRALVHQEDHNKTAQPTASPAPKAPHKDSSASVAERHLGPETQLIGHSFQQEFLSELETGAELLQTNAQLLVGQALSQSVWQLMETTSFRQPPRPEPGEGRKHQLTEAASESVYVTKDSLVALVQSYYSQMQGLTHGLQQDRSNSAREECERRESSAQLNTALLKELANWGRKPMSTEFHQRVELHKKRMLEQYDLEQEVACETLRRKKLAKDQTTETSKGQLQEAEEAFITELAALTRVSLSCTELSPADHNQRFPAAEEETPTLWRRREALLK